MGGPRGTKNRRTVWETSKNGEKVLTRVNSKKTHQVLNIPTMNRKKGKTELVRKKIRGEHTGRPTLLKKNKSGGGGVSKSSHGGILETKNRTET